MKKHIERGKSRKGRLSRLARALLNIGSPDVYCAGGQQFTQITIPFSDTQANIYIVPEQLALLSRQKIVNG